jgi:hypothetical protein
MEVSDLRAKFVKLFFFGYFLDKNYELVVNSFNENGTRQVRIEIQIDYEMGEFYKTIPR